MINRFITQVLILLFATVFIRSVSAAANAERPLVVAYLPTWIEMAAAVKALDLSKVTHVNLAFENPKNDAGELSWNGQSDAVVASLRAAGIRVLLSIGGGAASGDKKLKQRYATLLGPEKREAFVASLAAVVKKHQLDGLDVDLEGPSVDANYGAFVHSLSGVLHAGGKLVTAAVSQGYGGERVPPTAFTDLDLVHIMAYDGRGPWSPEAPGHHATLAMAQETLAWWKARGLATAKTTLGLPFYGYAFGADFSKSAQAYRDILAKHPEASGLDKVGNTVWYDGIPAIQAKCRIALEQKLAGVMIWSIDNDATGESSLLRAADAVLRKTSVVK